MIDRLMQISNDTRQLRHQYEDYVLRSEGFDRFYSIHIDALMKIEFAFFSLSTGVVFEHEIEYYAFDSRIVHWLVDLL
jgi:hypothetical protein